MSEWEVSQPLDYSATGDDIDSASQKIIATFADVYDKLNRLRCHDAGAGTSVGDASAYSFKVDTSVTPAAIMCRNGDNTGWVQIGAVAENMGITADDVGAITGNGLGKLSLGAEANLPANATTHDMYFAYDTGRLYMYLTGAWRVFLSLRFEDLLGVDSAVIERDEVAPNGVNKIPRLNSVGEGEFNITGSAAKIGDKPLYLPELRDGCVLAYSATRDRWEIAERDDIANADVSTTGEPDKIVKTDSNGKAHVDITGNAAKIATKTIDVSNLQDGDVLVYDATTGTFKNKKGAVVNAQGVVEANVSGSAQKWAGKAIQTVNMADGQILVWSESLNAFINRNQSAVGNARALSLRQDGVELANYNGDEYRAVNIITPHLRAGGQSYSAGDTCFSKNMPLTTYLECVTAGVAAAVEPDFSGVSIGDVVTDGGAEWKVCGYVNTEVTDTLDNRLTTAESDIDTLQLGYRQPSTAQSIGDIKYHATLPANWYLECTTAGTTGSGALTITSPTVGGTVSDGTVTWTIRKMESTEYHSRVIYDNAAAHNGIYRGEDLTTYFNSGEMSAAIADGSFRNIYPGDYITKSITIDGATYSNVKFIIMDLDYHLHCGDTETTAHHVAIMPEEQLGTAQMNSSHTTTGGYVGSAMWTTHIPKVVAGFEAAFGAAHILEHRELLSNAMDDNVKSNAYDGWSGAASNWAWVNVKANLANENMVYGAPVLSSSLYDTGECNSQLAAFRLNHGLICSDRYWWWLRSVAYSSNFCLVDGYGVAGYGDAAYSYGVRPIALLR